MWGHTRMCIPGVGDQQIPLLALIGAGGTLVHQEGVTEGLVLVHRGIIQTWASAQTKSSTLIGEYCT